MAGSAAATPPPQTAPQWIIVITAEILHWTNLSCWKTTIYYLTLEENLLYLQMNFHKQISMIAGIQTKSPSPPAGPYPPLSSTRQ